MIICPPSMAVVVEKGCTVHTKKKERTNWHHHHHHLTLLKKKKKKIFNNKSSAASFIFMNCVHWLLCCCSKLVLNLLLLFVFMEVNLESQLFWCSAVQFSDLKEVTLGCTFFIHSLEQNPASLFQNSSSSLSLLCVCTLKYDRFSILNK